MFNKFKFEKKIFLLLMLLLPSRHDKIIQYFGFMGSQSVRLLTNGNVNRVQVKY